MVRDQYPRLDRTYYPTPLGNYLIQCQVGEPLTVTLAPEMHVADDVERWSVRDLGAGMCRGLVLYVDDGRHPDRLHGKEGDRSEVRRWLTSMGVPALHVGGRKKK